MTPIEKAARAIAATQNFDFGGFNTATQAKYLKFAIAAIRAIREPDEGMREAGKLTHAHYENRQAFRSDIAAAIFRAMIDSILSEEEAKP